MIFTDRTIIVQKGTSSINDTIVLYRGDKGVEIRFALNEGSPFRFGSGASPNIIEKTEAAYGQLIIKTPNDLPTIFGKVTPTNEGKIVLMITSEMIDEITEVGNYTFQIRLLDENMNSRATLPEVVDGIEIREPIAVEDNISDTNEVGVAAVGYALTTVAANEDVFDLDGNYNKTTWKTKDRITAAKLNKIEAGIDGVNQKIASTGAGDISIADTGNCFTATNVEGALQEVGSQIKEKANDNEVVKKGYATLNDFDEDTRAVLQGLEPGTINAVLGKKNVKYDNTDFVDLVIDNSPFEPVNLYSKNTISEAGYYANTEDGQIINNQYTQNYVNTGFIEYHINIRYSTNNVASVCFYDENKNFISSIANNIDESIPKTTINNKEGSLISVPSECKYFIFNIYTSNIERAEIWQLDRYQDPIKNELCIPRLNLNKQIINNINGVKPINNVINLKPSDIGAIEQKQIKISGSLPYTLSDTFKECNGNIKIDTFLSNDTIILDSANKFDCNGHLVSSELCSYSFNDDGSVITITTDSAFGGWTDCYVSFDINNLLPNTEYRIKYSAKILNGFGSDETIKGIAIYKKEDLSAIKTIYYPYDTIQNVTFNSGDTGNIELRLYPKDTSNIEGNTINCEFRNLQITKADKDVAFSRFYNKSIAVTSELNTTALLLPSMEIRSANNVYNNSVSISKITDVGQVNSVNSIKADENGNVEIPKTIISGKVGVFFGDSVTEFGTYPQQVGDITGLTTYNVGVGGCRMSYHPTNGYNQFSMTKLADAISTKTWDAQEQAVTELIQQENDDNSEILSRMKNIDFDKVDYIIIAFGTNDFGGEVPLGDINSEPSDTVFYGAIKYVIETIINAYPHIKLYFVTPIFRWSIPGGGNNSDTTPKNGIYLNDYGKAIMKVCQMYHIPALDMYNKSNINALNHEYYISSDGTHPTIKGYTLIAEKVSKFLLSN